MLVSETSGGVKSTLTQQMMIATLWPDGWAAFRVIAVTDTLRSSDRNPHHPQFILTTSAVCYCTPTIEFWLSQDGMDDPRAELICLEFRPRQTSVHQPLDGVNFNVEFDWDGARFEGYFRWEHKQLLTWAYNQCCDGKIVDIKCQI